MKFKSFYGLSGIPFPKDISDADIFRYPAIDELLSRFDYMKKYRGTMLLTGQPGCGKSTAIRCFFSSLSPQNSSLFICLWLLSARAIFINS